MLPDSIEGNIRAARNYHPIGNGNGQVPGLEETILSIRGPNNRESERVGQTHRNSESEICAIANSRDTLLQAVRAAEIVGIASVSRDQCIRSWR